MSLIVNKLDLKDIVMVCGIIASICGAAISYANNASKINNTMEEIKSINIQMAESKKMNYDQSIILERITANLNYFTEQIKDIKQMVIDDRKESNRNLDRNEGKTKSRWAL